MSSLVLSAGVACPPRWFAVQQAMGRGIPAPLRQRTYLAALRIVPDATHLWNLQQPEAFNLTVGEWADAAEV